MKILYNEEEAKQRKIETEKEFWEQVERDKKKARKIKLIIACISIPLTIIAVLVFWKTSMLGMVIPSVLAFPLAAFLSTILLCPTPETEEDICYPADVKWYIKTNGCTVLKTEIKEDNFGICLYATLEDSHGIVVQKDICYLKRVVSTKAEEETVDLPNKKYLVPYNKEKG